MSYNFKEKTMPVDSSKELALFLEKMRFLRGISQEDFTDGIISNRQYQRYVRGESPMPYHLLDLFAERLNVKKEIIMLEFENHTVKEDQTIVDYHNSVMNFDFEKSTQLRKTISNDYIINPDNKKIFEYSYILEQFLSKKTSFEKCKTDLIELVNYPKILNQYAYSMVEIMILSSLLDFVSKDEQVKIATKIGTFLDNPELVWSGNQAITLNLVIFRLAKYYGVNDDHDNVIRYCKLGLKYNKRTFSYKNSEYYYYFLSISYFRTKQLDLFPEALVNCYFAIMIQENAISKIQQFTKYIKDDFNIEFKDFVIDYLKNKPGL